MKGHPIAKVDPMENGVMLVKFDTGNSAVIDMKPNLGGFRFGVLQKEEVWETVGTDGGFIFWYRNGMVVAELAYNENDFRGFILKEGK